MDITTIIGLVVVILIIMGIGGGGFFLFYVRSRPKKETWSARIYQLGESGKTVKMRGKNDTYNLRLRDLRPYAKDVVEKVEKAPGIVIYRLQRLNLKTPPIVSDVVDFWGGKNKEVNVLYHEGSCTVLKKGYDEHNGEIVFNPMSHDRIDLITGQMIIRKDRLQAEKTVWQAISPWIVAGILVIGMVSIAYFMGNAFVASSENFEAGSASIAASIREGMDGGQSSTPLVRPDAPVEPPEPPPSVE